MASQTPAREFIAMVQYALPDNDSLVIEFKPLVVKWAKKYVNRSHEYDDLYQVGMVGLLRGAALYDPSRGTPPLAYLSWWVKGQILNYKRDTNYIKLSRQQFYDFDNHPQIASIFTNAWENAGNEQNDGYADGSIYHDTPVEFPHQEIYEGELMQAVVDILPERERKALCMAFLEGKSQRQIGREIGFSQMHTGRILRGAIQALQEHFRVTLEEVA